MRIGILFSVLAALTLSGCAISSIGQATKPNDLYALTPKSTFASDLPRIRSQIVVEEPTATAAVDTDQIAVMPSALQVQYLQRARWVDRAPLIIQALLIESFENTGKVPAVGRSTVGLRADYVIVTDVREFQAIVVKNEAGEEALQIDVRLNVKIIDEFEDQIIASESFEKVRYAASREHLDIATAFDSALGSAMRSAVEWSIRRIARHGG
ncbi:MAG: ABC-type transport auxiliary lipoprotein family protein [Paracoccaceae bacterium]